MADVVDKYAGWLNPAAPAASSSKDDDLLKKYGAWLGPQYDWKQASDQEMRRLHPDRYAPKDGDGPGIVESALRGAAQAATLGNADELTGLAESAFTDKTYEQARDESRANYAAAEAAHPIAYGAGGLAGGVATSFIPGLNVGAGATLAEVAGKMGLAGAIGGVGSSEADLLHGDVAGVAKDAAVGGVVGAGLGAAAHGAGKLIGRIGEGAPAREDKRLLTDLGTDALPSTYKTMGRNADDVVTTAKELGLDQVARRGGAGDVLGAASDAKAAVGDQLAGVLESPGQKRWKDVLSVLEKERDGLEASPGNQVRLSKLEKLITDVKQKLPGNELADADLIDAVSSGSGRFAKKIGTRADETTALLRETGLDKLTHDPAARAAAAKAAMEEAGQGISSVYDAVDAHPIRLGDIIKPLQEEADSMRAVAGLKQRREALEAYIADLRSAHAAELNDMHKAGIGMLAQEGKVEEAKRMARALIDESPVSPKALHREVQAAQTRAFESASPTNAKDAQKFSQNISKKLKDVLHAHVAEAGGDDAINDLTALNKRYSLLSDIHAAAKEQAAKMPGAVVAPTGDLDASELHRLIKDVGPENYIKPTRSNQFERDISDKLRGVLHEHVGPERAAQLEKLQRQERAVDLIKEAAENRVSKEATKPTGLREIMGNQTLTGSRLASLAIAGPAGLAKELGGELAMKAGKAAVRGTDRALAKLYLAAKAGNATAQTIRDAIEAGVPRRTVYAILGIKNADQ